MSTARDILLGLSSLTGPHTAREHFLSININPLPDCPDCDDVVITPDVAIITDLSSQLDTGTYRQLSGVDNTLDKEGVVLAPGQSMTVPINTTIKTIAYMLDDVLMFRENTLSLSTFVINTPGKHSNYIFYKGRFTDEQKDYLRDNPDKFLYYVKQCDGRFIIKSKILTAGEINDIVVNLLMFKDDTFVRDMIHYSEVEEVLLGVPLSDGINNTSSYDLTTQTFKFFNQSNGRVTWKPGCKVKSSNKDDDVLHVVSYSIDVLTGSSCLDYINVGTKEGKLLTKHIDEILEVGLHEESFFGYLHNNNELHISFGKVAYSTFDLTTKINIRKLNYIYPIVTN